MSGYSKPLQALADALRSPFSLRAFPIAITVPVSVAVIPFVEGAAQPQYIFEWSLASLIGQIPGILILVLGWWIFYRNRTQVPLLTLPVLSLAAGAVKGFSSQISAEMMIYGSWGSLELVEKTIGSSLSWMFGLSFVGTISYLILSSKSKLMKLQVSLLSTEEKALTARQQLNRIVEQRLSGIDKELSKEFLKLVKLQDRRFSASQRYDQMIELIRRFNSTKIRPLSSSLWAAASPNLPFKQAAKLNFLENPMPAVLCTISFLIGSVVTELRSFGVSVGLLLSLSTGLMMVTLILITVNFKLKVLKVLRPHLVALVSAIGSLFLQILFTPERGSTFLALNFTINLLWAETIIFICGWLSLSWALSNNQLEQTQKQLSLSEDELSWLEMRVESANREMAKHLHGIVQTRLLALSLNMQRDSDGTSQTDAFEEVVNLLTHPMAGFESDSNDLGEELSKLAAQWKGIVNVTFDIDNCDLKLEVTPTMQMIREALSNSSKHGEAEKFHVVIKDAEDMRLIDIVDNGIGPTEGKRGLGSVILDSISRSNWSLERYPTGGAWLRASVNLNKN